MKKSAALIKCRYYYSLNINGDEAFYFSGIDHDSIFTDISTKKENSSQTKYAVGCWINKYSYFPSCEGRLMTVYDDGSDSLKNISPNNLLSIISKEKSTLEKKIHNLDTEARELKYYLSIHNVQDEGYNMISEYAVKINYERDSTKKLLKKIDSLKKFTKIEIKYTSKFNVFCSNSNSKKKMVLCRLIASDNKSKIRLLQISNMTTPDGIKALSLNRLMQTKVEKGNLIFIAGYSGINENYFDADKTKANILPGHIKSHSDDRFPHSIPALLAADGSPVFNKNGLFVGISYKGKVLSPKHINTLLKDFH